jgi:hypothetical protein
MSSKLDLPWLLRLSAREEREAVVEALRDRKHSQDLALIRQLALIRAWMQRRDGRLH